VLITAQVTLTQFLHKFENALTSNNYRQCAPQCFLSNHPARSGSSSDLRHLHLQRNFTKLAASANSSRYFVGEIQKKFSSTMQLSILESILYISPLSLQMVGWQLYTPVLPPSYPLAVRNPDLSGISYSNSLLKDKPQLAQLQHGCPVTKLSI
jgi:hypothetical protein